MRTYRRGLRCCLFGYKGNTRAEYKKLMNDSLKGRTAFVRAKFGISSNFKITGVDISLV